MCVADRKLCKSLHVKYRPVGSGGQELLHNWAAVKVSAVMSTDVRNRAVDSVPKVLEVLLFWREGLVCRHVVIDSAHGLIGVLLRRAKLTDDATGTNDEWEDLHC